MTPTPEQIAEVKELFDNAEVPTEGRAVYHKDQFYWSYYNEPDEGCLWRDVEPGKVMGLSCPCPKCTAR